MQVKLTTASATYFLRSMQRNIIGKCVAVKYQARTLAFSNVVISILFSRLTINLYLFLNLLRHKIFNIRQMRSFYLKCIAIIGYYKNNLNNPKRKHCSSTFKKLQIMDQTKIYSPVSLPLNKLVLFSDRTGANLVYKN